MLVHNVTCSSHFIIYNIVQACLSHTFHHNTILTHSAVVDTIRLSASVLFSYLYYLVIFVYFVSPLIFIVYLPLTLNNYSCHLLELSTEVFAVRTDLFTYHNN